MPGKEPTLREATADKKIRPALMAWAKRYYNDEQLQFLYDALDNKPARFLYDTYIAENAPKMINLQAKFMRPMRELVTLQGDAAYSQMGKLMGEAREEMYDFLAGTYAVGKDSFLVSPELQTHLAGGVKREPKVANFITAVGLNAAKAKAIEPLLEMYLNARSATDAYQAYEAMQKLATKSALDPALASAGKPVAPVVAAHEKALKEGNSALVAANNAKLAAKYTPTITKDLAEANKYLTSALKTANDKVKMKTVNKTMVTNMFNSGRQRVEKVNLNWLKAVKLDPGYAGKNIALAANKKKMDEDYADYRKALGAK